MKNRSLKKIKTLQFLTRKEGMVMSVEMVILLPLIALILVSLIEIGFLWFVRHTLTNASREGARAAVVYVSEAYLENHGFASRKNFVQQEAQEAVDTYLNGINFYFFDTWEVNATESTESWSTGDPVTVTVTTPSGLLLLDKLITSFSNITVQGVTTMRLE